MELINDILGVMRQLRENNFKIIRFEISQAFLADKLIPIFNETEWYNKPFLNGTDRQSGTLFGYPLQIVYPFYQGTPEISNIRIIVMDNREEFYASWNNDNIVITTGEIQTRIIKRN